MSRIVDSYLSILLTRFLDNHQEKEKLHSLGESLGKFNYENRMYCIFFISTLQVGNRSRGAIHVKGAIPYIITSPVNNAEQMSLQLPCQARSNCSWLVNEFQGSIHKYTSLPLAHIPLIHSIYKRTHILV